MERRHLEIKVVSARGLKVVNLFTNMDVYAVVSIKGDPYISSKKKKGDPYKDQKQRTHVHKDCGPNPTWNFTMQFIVDEADLQQNRLTLKIKIKSDRTLGDKEIGKVHVPIRDLLDRGGDGTEFQNVSYSVRRESGKVKGTLNIAYKFGDKAQSSAMASPPAGYSGASSPTHPHAPCGSEAPPSPVANPYSPPGAYSEPSQYSHGGYPTPPPPLGANPYPTPGAYPERPQYAYGGYPNLPPSSGEYPYPPPVAYPPQPQYPHGGYPAPPPFGYPYPRYPLQQQPRAHSQLNEALTAGNLFLGVATFGDRILGTGAEGLEDPGAAAFHADSNYSYYGD